MNTETVIAELLAKVAAQEQLMLDLVVLQREMIAALREIQIEQNQQSALGLKVSDWIEKQQR